MLSAAALRQILRIIAVVGIAMVVVQLAIASQNLESPSNDAVRLAGLGLPLLFLAFLNLIVWTQPGPRRNLRLFTHFANGLLLVAAILVMRAVPVLFAFAVAGCTAMLSVISFLLEIHLQQSRGAGTR